MAAVRVHPVEAEQIVCLQPEYDPSAIRGIGTEECVRRRVMEVGETSQAGAVGPHRHDICGILGLEVVRVFGYRDPADSVRGMGISRRDRWRGARRLLLTR
jgi:hypothetical protein